MAQPEGFPPRLDIFKAMVGGYGDFSTDILYFASTLDRQRDMEMHQNLRKLRDVVISTQSRWKICEAWMKRIHSHVLAGIHLELLLTVTLANSSL